MNGQHGYYVQNWPKTYTAGNSRKAGFINMMDIHLNVFWPENTFRTSHFCINLK